MTDLSPLEGDVPDFILVSAPPPEQATATVVELGYSPGQKRDTKGRFGSGGGTTIGVSRERPELGGGEVHSYSDLEAARRNPVIAEAERTTTSDLEQLDIDVTSQRHVAGVFEGGGEPSLSVKLGPTSTMADIEIAGAYLVRRNEQDSVIVTVGGAEMERLGLTPNATTIRIEGLPTDRASRDRVFEDIQKHTPFASWDEERGTVAVSSFDADIDDGMRANLAGLAATHGGRMTAEPVHERWYFQDEQLRTDAKEYLHPADPSVLRTPDEVRSDHPTDERTAAIPGPRQGGGGPDVGGGAGTGEGAALLGYHPPGPVAEALTPWAYSPGQKRDTKGRFGSGGGSTGGVQQHTPEEDEALLTDAIDRLAAVGVDVSTGPDGVFDSDLRRIDRRLVPEVVAGFEAVAQAYPGIAESGSTVSLKVVPMALGTYAETDSWSGMPPDTKGRYVTGAIVSLNQSYWENADSFRATIQEQATKKWLADPSPEGIVKHEMGHVVHGVLQIDVDAHYRLAAQQSQGPSGYANAIDRDADTGEWSTPHIEYHERFAETFTTILNGESLDTQETRLVIPALEKLK